MGKGKLIEFLTRKEEKEGRNRYLSFMELIFFFSTENNPLYCCSAELYKSGGSTEPVQQSCMCPAAAPYIPQIKPRFQLYTAFNGACRHVIHRKGTN